MRPQRNWVFQRPLSKRNAGSWASSLGRARRAARMTRTIPTAWTHSSKEQLGRLANHRLRNTNQNRREPTPTLRFPWVATQAHQVGSLSAPNLLRAAVAAMAPATTLVVVATTNPAGEATTLELLWIRGRGARTALHPVKRAARGRRHNCLSAFLVLTRWSVTPRRTASSQEAIMDIQAKCRACTRCLLPRADSSTLKSTKLSWFRRMRRIILRRTFRRTPRFRAILRRIFSRTILQRTSRLLTLEDPGRRAILSPSSCPLRRRRQMPRTRLPPMFHRKRRTFSFSSSRHNFK
mmetsp:Transcript_36669/g.86253  ORF Transcript_36669/g.86253 Transcript_36669/m.86253 type:complete len:293 (-) Transcript_36669:220-1098(-)